MNLTGRKSPTITWPVLIWQQGIVPKNAREFVKKIRTVVVWTSIQKMSTKCAESIPKPGEMTVTFVLILVSEIIITTTAQDQVGSIAL